MRRWLAVGDRVKRKEEREKAAIDPGLHVLSESEVNGCIEMSKGTAERPWGIWVREVERNLLYENNA